MSLSRFLFLHSLVILCHSALNAISIGSLGRIDQRLMIHVAILMKPYLDLILSGRKTIESRLTKTNRPPYDSIEVGERIYFKQSSGPFRATAIAEQVLCLDRVTPQRVMELQHTYNDAICGTDDFWEWKRDSRFVTLIWLREVESVEIGPGVAPQRGIAWLGLDENLDVYPACLTTPNESNTIARQLKFAATAPADDPNDVIVLPLTDGNIRNAHVSIRGETPGSVRGQFPDWAFGGATKETQSTRLLRLEFADGAVVETDIVAGKNIFRVRGVWRKWFKENGASAGDALLLFPLGVGHYAVRLGQRRK